MDLELTSQRLAFEVDAMGVMDYAVENGVRHGETANHLGRALRLSAVRESDGDLAFVGSSSTLFFLPPRL
jgi:hypothetical protein